MFRFYFGVGIMCVIFSVVSLLLSNIGGEMLATVFIAMGGAFLAIAFVTSGPHSRW